MSAAAAWAFLPWGYLATVAIETPVLLAGLSPPHSWKRRLYAGAWLTACTYPIVILVLPLLIDADAHRVAYLAVAETFAPLAECLLFAAAFHGRGSQSATSRVRDFVAITIANLASFGLGTWLVATLE